MQPLTLLIKPAAGLCDMDCRYCFYKAASGARENRIMTGETVDALIRGVRAFRPSALSVVFQGGEPTLAGLDFFKSFVSRVKERISAPVSYAVQTNGLLINDGFAAFFKENGFLVGVSLDGAEKTNDRYRLDKDGGSVFSRVLDAARLLEKHGVDFNILSVIDDENAKDVDETYAFFKRRGFRYLQFIPCVDEGRGVSLSPAGYAAFLNRLFDLWWADYVNGDYVSVRNIDNHITMLMGEPPENCAMRGVCGSYFTVEADGSVYPCDFYCKEDFLLGSVFDENPFEMGRKQREFIEQSLIIHEGCACCEYHFLCRGGCRRDRTEDLKKNVYCSAYKAFFDHSLERMEQIASRLSGTAGIPLT